MIEKYGDNYIFLLFIMNDNKKAIGGSSIKAIRYLKKIKDKIVKPLSSPLSKRIKETKEKSKLGERRNIKLKINTNIQYKGWDDK